MMVKRHRDPGTGHCGGEAFGVLPSGPGLVKAQGTVASVGLK